MFADKYFEKITELGVEIKEKLLNLLRENKIESLNIYPYYTEISLINYNFYDCDNDGNAIAYNLDTIVMKDNMPIFQMSDNEGYYATTYKINEFNTLDVLYILDTLETLFNEIKSHNLPLLKKGETFDDIN